MLNKPCSTIFFLQRFVHVLIFVVYLKQETGKSSVSMPSDTISRFDSSIFFLSLSSPFIVGWKYHYYSHFPLVKRSRLFSQPSSRLFARSHFSNQDFETTMIVTLTMEIFSLQSQSRKNVGQTRALAFFIQICNILFFANL